MITKKAPKTGDDAYTRQRLFDDEETLSILEANASGSSAKYDN